MPEDNRLDAVQSALQELKDINRVLDRICRVRETNHIMSIIIDELISLTDAGQGVINLISPAEDSDLITVIRRQASQTEDFPYKISSLITGWVLKNNRLLKIDNLDADERFGGLSSENGKFKSIICSPMVVRGETIGLTALVRNQERGPFTEDQCRLVGIIVSQSAQILSNALLLDELAQKNKLLEISQKKLHDENISLKAELDAHFSFENIIGNSPAIKRVLTLASKVASNDSPLLIIGATGTGKELIARAIHHSSPRGRKPFVVKNCGIKTESLLEAELFGYVKGAFTGADRDRPGLFREASGGTIFLDEIGEAPLPTQVAILRVIETGEIRPVGAAKTEFVDVRVISATNRDLREEIKKGTFREDLFYRLNTFIIELPSLNQRREDIPLLVHYFLRQLQVKLGTGDLSVTPAALNLLSNYQWPGNIRQLENEIERAAVINDRGGEIDICDFSPEILSRAGTAAESHEYQGVLREAVEKVEKDIILSTLRENKGNILKSSRLLGLTRKGLKDKIARYGLKIEIDE
ncbi:hypothetical protein TRIP_C80017 [Candidatus Zixiibacteriota bacterium]|nr:hypothetical protein TRIP_C80017 [candidate division Zixibacteria bacterium]